MIFESYSRKEVYVVKRLTKAVMAFLAVTTGMLGGLIGVSAAYAPAPVPTGDKTIMIVGIVCAVAVVVVIVLLFAKKFKKK